ncbi:putative transcriptional regulator [Janibacter sp. HTCC2649]|uniref:TetR/AcrR family transcriptional regulator n=1 Tax=Janibacter sp. HTCC2649 TaxID=313589 RepID=UPI0000670E55|nr:TetR/AcrR family transcriptional regulator [Janibacter sp. HTCC2649]EAP97230.1 putative transcriptional regulator [Janibacter sp. HTCC2649]
MTFTASPASSDGTDSPTSRRRGPAKGTPRAPRMKREERERQLLDVAESVFAEHGYQDTTMETIAAAAGITKPVIYDHFGSKENLLVAVVARAREDLLSSTAAALDALPPHSPVEAHFRAGVRSFMQFFEARRGSFRVYMQESAVAVVAGQDIENLRQAQAREIAERFSGNAAIAAYPMVYREAMAEIMIATNERVAAWRLRNPEIDLDTAVEIVMAVLWNGFGSYTAETVPGVGVSPRS